jgi:hypothetical protein
VEALRLLSRCRSRHRGIEAAVEVSRLVLRCQRRGRGVNAAVEVSMPRSRCQRRVEVEAAVEVLRLLSRY